MERKYVVAGGAGFLGSHTVDFLLESGHNVVVLDDFSTGSMNNLDKHIDSPHLEIFETDITERVPDIKDVDGVFHLACHGNPSDYENAEINTLSANSFGTVNLLNLARRNDAWFVYFSSSEIYGNHLSIPKDGLEEGTHSIQSLLHKRSHYPIGKMFGEEITKRYCDESDIEYLIIRPFNIYGPRMDSKSEYGRVIINFFKWALNQKPCVVNGDGMQTRSFLYIDDFISFIKRIMESNIAHLNWNVVNVGYPREITILELAKMINKITRNKAGIKHAPRYPEEPMFRLPNIERARELGWEPEISLEEGLERLMDQLLEVV